jgi:hypothetical protein
MRSREVVKKQPRQRGRPPQGDIKGKSKTLTTRITLETRTALDRGAHEANVSLSQHIERLLKIATRKHIQRRPDIQAIAEFVALLIESIETETDRKWQEDAFTSAAIRHAMENLLLHYGSRGEVVVPPKVEEYAADLGHSEHAKILEDIGIDVHDVLSASLRTPDGFGRWHCTGIITRIGSIVRLSNDEFPDADVLQKASDEWKQKASYDELLKADREDQIRRDLGDPGPNTGRSFTEDEPHQIIPRAKSSAKRSKKPSAKP